MDNTDQIDYWNGPAGEKWVAEADQLDSMLSAFIEPVLDAGDVPAGRRVLDVGCGSGALSFAALNAGAEAVTGVDVSVPMLALARKRSEGRPKARFIEADAATWQADAPFDRLISRFGVMFFASPEEAFSNLHRQMSPGAGLAFACWQPLKRNEWALAPLEASLQLATEPPELPPAGAPGPFAFADADRTVSILGRAGWKDLAAEAWTGRIPLPGNSVREAAQFATQVGPTARLIAQQELDRARVQAAIEQVLTGKAGEDGRVWLDAAVWIVTGRA